jgi:CxxC-x17-CxxC domain-containing protein
MGKNNTKAEKAKRNLEYAKKFKKRRPSGRGGRPAFRPSPAQGSSAPAGGHSERPSFEAVCTTCGTKTTVPFEPTPGKPVLCRSCFTANRPV